MSTTHSGTAALTADELRFAAEWLRQYDDTHDGGEQTAIAERVAEWLDYQADAKELRELAATHGVPVGKLRAKLAAIAAATGALQGDVE